QHAKARPKPLGLDLYAAKEGAGLKTVPDETAPRPVEPLHHLADGGVVRADHAPTAGFEIVEVLGVAFLELGEAAVIVLQVIGFDAGDDRDLRSVAQERAVALVGLRDQQAARAVLGAADARQL